MLLTDPGFIATLARKPSLSRSFADTARLSDHSAS
jgi:hypothetical protein